MPQGGAIAANSSRASPIVSVGDAGTAVPAGRLGCDLRADPLTLYAVISAEAWAALWDNGVLTGREDLIDRDYTDAYAWMRSAMARRGLGDTWPVWLWAKVSRYELAKQVRHAARHRPGSALITARIPRDRLLLSEFQAWHCILNHAPVFRPDATDADIDAYYGTLEAKPHEQAARTWELIFNRAVWPRGAHWQAVTAELRLSDVTHAVVLQPPP